jgi:hypothetical protein
VDVQIKMAVRTDMKNLSIIVFAAVGGIVGSPFSKEVVFVDENNLPAE